ncbi:transposase [Streptomyces platensis]|uniref:transposase n=1 Tax=Streptomyces platensis TaxID=58346 RepID=UPI0036CD4734
MNWRLFLPKTWDPACPQADPDKEARRERCTIPADVGHVEKWQLALDVIDETRPWGTDVPLVVADAGYAPPPSGTQPALRDGSLHHGAAAHPRLRRPRLLHPPAPGPIPKTEPLPGRPRAPVTPHGLDRRRPHLSPRHTDTQCNLPKPY